MQDAFRALLLLSLLSFGSGCSSVYNFSVSHSNLADSYIDPYRVAFDGKASFPAGFSGCSNGRNVASESTMRMKTAPKFITVEWLHVLSDRYYRARILLSPKTAEWLRDPPFRQNTIGNLAIIIQWRGERRVAAMLVANLNDFSQGRMDLGAAVGELMPTPENRPNYSGTYETMRKEAGDRFLPGEVFRYQRRYDAALTREQRFGCPRRQDGSVVEWRLPPKKLPFVYGENGEHIPCSQYACTDKYALIRKLRKLEGRRYPADSTPPAMIFNEAANPEPAW